jgi:hypothetical protein
MMDDIDRDCCSGVEAILMRGLGLRDDDYSSNTDGRWKVVRREFHDPGMTLYLQHMWGPKVTVTISYNWKG